MARIVKPLSPTEIKNAKPKEKEYTLSDGEGLLLLILPSGSKSWRFNYARPLTGKRTKMALGGYPELSLAEMLVLNVKNIVRYLRKVSIHKKKKSASNKNMKTV